VTTATAGRTVLVTGASSGIGAAVARVLAARGDTVALVARRIDRLDDVLADCRTSSPASERWAADLSDASAAATLALTIWDHFDGIDVVINNAGAPMRRHASRLTMADVERAMTLNYFSPVAITLARSDASARTRRSRPRRVLTGAESAAHSQHRGWCESGVAHPGRPCAAGS